MGKPATEYLPLADRAAARVGDLDRVVDESVVRGIVNGLKGDLWGAVRMYEGALALEPDDDLALRLLADVRARLGHDALAAALLARWADLFPGDGDVSSQAASALFQAGEFDKTTRFRERALRAANTNPYERCWLRVMPAEIAWQRGDLQLAAALAETVIRSLDVEGFERDETIRRAAEVLLLSGLGDAAEKALEGIRNVAVRRDELRAWLALVSNHHTAPEMTPRDLPQVVYVQDAAYIAGLYALRGGIPPALLEAARTRAADEEARGLLQAEALKSGGDGAGATARYERLLASPVAVSAGDTGADIERVGSPRVDSGVEYRGGHVGMLLYAHFSMAECRLREGQAAEAVGLLEKLISERSRVLLGGLPGLLAYTRGHELLAAVYERRARPADAARIRRALAPLISWRTGRHDRRLP